MAKKIKRRPTKAIEWEEIIRLINSLKEDSDSFYLMILLQSFLGLRIGDLRMFKYKHIVGISEIEIIEEKTGKTRKLVFNKFLVTAINKHLEGRYFKMNDYLFLNKRRSGVLTTSYINKRVKQLFKKYDIVCDGNISTHLFRKSFCTEILRNYDYSDKGILVVNKILNHANISTTMLYLGLDEKEKDDAYNMLTL